MTKKPEAKEQPRPKFKIAQEVFFLKDKVADFYNPQKHCGNPQFTVKRSFISEIGIKIEWVREEGSLETRSFLYILNSGEAKLEQELYLTFEEAWEVLLKVPQGE